MKCNAQLDFSYSRLQQANHMISSKILMFYVNRMKKNNVNRMKLPVYRSETTN